MKNFPVFGKKVYAVLLLLAVAAVYGQFLWNPLVFDDQQFFMIALGDPLERYRHFLPFEFRWLPMATLAWTAQGLGLDLIWFRLGNLLLHAGTGIALFLFLNRLFCHVLPTRNGEQAGLPHIWAAFFAALLFVLHPVAVYGAGYLVQRTLVMATLFAILALHAYMRGLTEQRSGWLWGSVALYYLAVFAKEHAVMLPAVMLALTLLLEKPARALVARIWGVFAAFGLIVLLVMLQKAGLVGAVYEFYAPDILKGERVEDAYALSVLTQSWLFFKYGLMWLFPNPAWMSVDMREPFADSLWSPYLLAMGAFLAWGGLAVWLLLKRGRLGLLGFALLFPWLLFMTEFSAVRIQETFVLYRSYLWAVGGFALLPLVVWKFTARGAMLMLAVVCLFMVPLAMERLSTFSHTYLLWDDAERLARAHPELPGVYRIYYNRGTEFIKLGKYDDAIADLKRSIELFEAQPPAYGNLGWAYLKKGDAEPALQAYNKAIEKSFERGGNPFPQFYMGRARAYEAMNNAAAARENYRLACDLAKQGCDKVDSPAAGGNAGSKGGEGMMETPVGRRPGGRPH